MERRTGGRSEWGTQWGNREGEATWLESACGDRRDQGSTITTVAGQGTGDTTGPASGWRDTRPALSASESPEQREGKTLERGGGPLRGGEGGEGPWGGGACGCCSFPQSRLAALWVTHLFAHTAIQGLFCCMLGSEYMHGGDCAQFLTSCLVACQNQTYSGAL